MAIWAIVLCVALAFAVWFLRSMQDSGLRPGRRQFVELCEWPAEAAEQLLSTYAHLTPSDADQVGWALKQFFVAYVESGFKPVTMPSRAASDFWLELTRDHDAYQKFCQEAFGRYFPHPGMPPARPTEREMAGLRRTWLQVCRIEEIDPFDPDRLPLLFGLDEKLKIRGGIDYDPEADGLFSRASTSAR
ncbi:MAG: hypothetical protein AAF441_21105 [Pseudomonadota bacterium]